MPAEVSQSISSKSGAGVGAKAFKTSLNLSTATPIAVLVEKSVNNPSSYEPSSAAPIVPPPEPVAMSAKDTASPSEFM